MKAESEAYFLAVPGRLRTLDPNMKPIWGGMSPQHMVEHLVGSWRISNGRAKINAVLQPEEIEKRRLFLFSNQPYGRNVPNPVFREGLPALRKPILAAAIDQLEDEMREFFNYHNTHPGAIETHPVFGDLDYEGWLIFQTKHMGHHLAQFGL